MSALAEALEQVQRRAVASLAKYAYMVERGGEDYPERAYGIRYQR